MKYKKELRNQMDENVKRIERPNKMSVEERKINKDLLQAAREYFNFLFFFLIYLLFLFVNFLFLYNNKLLDLYFLQY